MSRIRPGERVHDVDVLLVKEGHDFPAQTLEPVFLDRLVHAAPGDALLRAGLLHDELVERRAAGVLAGVDDERAASASQASPRSNAWLYSIEVVGFQYTCPRTTTPCWASSSRSGTIAITSAPSYATPVRR